MRADLTMPAPVPPPMGEALATLAHELRSRYTFVTLGP
jgi:hypothetical protein